MMTEQPFLDTIKEMPGDNSRWWPYADFLEEHGDDRAEIIRLLSGAIEPETVELIDSLTDKQESWLSIVRDYWLGVGLATVPANRKLAESSAVEAYKSAGLEPPSIFVWLDSPLAGCVGSLMLLNSDQVGFQVRDQVRGQVWDQVRGQVREQVRYQVRGQVWDQVWDQVRDQVREQVRYQVRGQVRDQVGGQVRYQVWGQVREQVRDQVLDKVWGQVREQVRDQVGGQVGDKVLDKVWDQVGGQVLDQVGGQVRDQVSKAGYGQHDSGWLAFYSMFRSLGLKCCERLDGLNGLALSCGWWWPFERAVILTERPTLLLRDGSGELHADDGPAILYPDGFAVYSTHGARRAK